MNPYFYRAELARVVDGDTVDLKIDLGFYMTANIRIRLEGVDTPEIRGPEKEEGKISKAFVEKKLSQARSIFVETMKTGKYGRWLGVIWFYEGTEETALCSLNKMLLDEGLAKPYGK